MSSCQRYFVDWTELLEVARWNSGVVRWYSSSIHVWTRHMVRESGRYVASVLAWSLTRRWPLSQA